MEYSVYVGTSYGRPRDFARGLHAALAAPAVSVLVLVDPQARCVEIVTGKAVRDRLKDGDVDAVAASMCGQFEGGDFPGGLVQGVLQLASATPRRG